ncbi:hypothetical protein T4D_11777 [Trichinella pseudospiralis]|uniref:Uncharacterized protein n=1 Tax=Trichinella pseudospiralis TaxID=6337 RepID=A0A0V1F6I7_TRIPS|nr:hypothetical protein T4D_11777 [Trichinella pseudospiralis]
MNKHQLLDCTNMTETCKLKKHNATPTAFANESFSTKKKCCRLTSLNFDQDILGTILTEIIPVIREFQSYPEKNSNSVCA